MQCPKCHYLRSARDTGPTDTCPRCGIIYAKFDPAVEKSRAELKVIAESRLHLQGRTHSFFVNLNEAVNAWGRHYSWLGKLIGVLIVVVACAAFIVVVWSFFAVVLGVALTPSPKIINVFIGGR